MSAPLHSWLDRIHQGDCLDVMRQLPDQCVDLIVTSPPYNIRNSTGGGMRGGSGLWKSGELGQGGYADDTDDKPHAQYVAEQRERLTEMMRLVKDDGAIFYVHKWRVQGGLIQDRSDILAGFPERCRIIWDRGSGYNHNPGYPIPSYEVVYLLAKPGFREADSGIRDVWQIAPEKGSWHPAPFPLELARRAIAYTSAQVVLDPYMGSGTTAVAALLEGRHYIGIERNADYCRKARKRILKAGREGSQPEGSQPEGSQPEGSQPEGSQPEGSQPEGSQPEGSQPEGSQVWDEAPVRWGSLDKTVYDHIAKLQKGSKLQAVPLDQRAMAIEFGCSPRTLNGAISKLKNAGNLHILYQRGPSLYSVSSEPPRWPVRVAGGIGSVPEGSQPEGSQNARVPGPGTGLTNPSVNQDIKPGSRFPVSGALECEPGTEGNAAACPWHPEANLHPVTTYRNLAKIMQATGDEIRYCRGSNGRCSWVHSRDLGTVVAEGGSRLDAQGIEAAYYDLRSAAKPATSSDTRRTGYLDSYRLRHGRLPWEDADSWDEEA